MSKNRTAYAARIDAFKASGSFLPFFFAPDLGDARTTEQIARDLAPYLVGKPIPPIPQFLAPVTFEDASSTRARMARAASTILAGMSSGRELGKLMNTCRRMLSGVIGRADNASTISARSASISTIISASVRAALAGMSSLIGATKRESRGGRK